MIIVYVIFNVLSRGKTVYYGDKLKMCAMAEGYNHEEQTKNWKERLAEITEEANKEVREVQSKAEEAILENTSNLTMKQEMFARMYAETRDGVKSYVTAYEVGPETKKSTIYAQAWKLKSDPKIATRIKELQTDIEDAVGLSKIKQLKELQRVYAKCMESSREMEWREVEEEYIQKNGKIKTRKKNKLVPKCDEFGRPVFSFDSKGANTALQEINKLMGYHSPIKQEHTGKNGGAIQTESNLSPEQVDTILGVLNEAKK